MKRTVGDPPTHHVGAKCMLRQVSKLCIVLDLAWPALFRSPFAGDADPEAKLAWYVFRRCGRPLGRAPWPPAAPPKDGVGTTCPGAPTPELANEFPAPPR